MDDLIKNINKRRVLLFTGGLGLGLGIGLLLRMPVRKVWAIVQYVRHTVYVDPNQKMVLIVSNDLNISPGKIASHCLLASISCFSTALKVNRNSARMWSLMGQPKVVLRYNQPGGNGLHSLSEKAKTVGVISAMIQNTNTLGKPYTTVVGLGPGQSNAIDHISGHLKLL